MLLFNDDSDEYVLLCCLQVEGALTRRAYGINGDELCLTQFCLLTVHSA